MKMLAVHEFGREMQLKIQWTCTILKMLFADSIISLPYELAHQINLIKLSGYQINNAI